MLHMRRREFIAAPRQCGGVAARGVCAARGDARCGFSSSSRGGEQCAVRRRFPKRSPRIRLCRGPERHDRVPLGGRTLRSAARIGGRSGPAPGRRDMRGLASSGAGSKGRDRQAADRLRRRKRSGRNRPGCDTQQACRQCHRVSQFTNALMWKTAGAVAGTGAGGSPDRRAAEFGQRNTEINTRDLQAAARAVGQQIQIVGASREEGIEPAFAALAQQERWRALPRSRLLFP